MALAEKTIEDIQHKTTQLTGKIAIVNGELKSSQFLAELIASFHNEHPEVQFEIYSGNSDNIKERIDRGILDIGLLVEPVDMSKYNFVRTPFKERWGVLVNEDSELAGKKEVTPADLIRFPVIMSQREMVQNELLNLFGDYADQLQNIAAGNLLYNLAALARCRIGSVITLELNCSYDSLRFIPFKPALETGTVC
ncbi:MAG: substrate-binding domain-containing protein [Ruminococcus sp.]